MLNAIGGSFFMVNYSNIVLYLLRKQFPNWKPSVNDLKIYFQVRKYEQIFKIGGDNATKTPILNQKSTKNKNKNPLFAMINQFYDS